VSRFLLVASAGGHLDELLVIVRAWGIEDDDHVWVTSRTHQSESLLAGRNVIWLPRVGSGETRKAVRAFPEALQIERQILQK